MTVTVCIRAAESLLYVAPVLFCCGCHQEYLAQQRAEPIATAEAMGSLETRSRLQGGIRLAEATFESPGVTSEISLNLRRAQSEVDAGRPAQASHFYKRVLRDAPDHVLAHHRLAVIADEAQDFSTAERHYRAALVGRPGDAAILNDLGYSYLLQGRFAESERVLREAIRAPGPTDRAVTNLALLYATLGDYERALDALSVTNIDRAAASNRLARMIEVVNRDAPPAMLAPYAGEGAPALSSFEMPGPGGRRNDVITANALQNAISSDLPEIRPAQNSSPAVGVAFAAFETQASVNTSRGLPVWSPEPDGAASEVARGDATRPISDESLHSLPLPYFDSQTPPNTISAAVYADSLVPKNEREDVFTMVGHSRPRDELSK
jgi:hypothetical protein